MERKEVEELVQNTVRKINTGPEACLTNPRVLSFFNMMKDSFHKCLKAVASSATTPEERTAAYQVLLSWTPERIAEEVELITKRYPSVKDSYTYAAVYIVEQTYKKDNGQLKLKLPSFQSFMYTFYTTMMNSEPMQKGTYESLQFFEKEMLCCQSFCNALYNSIRTEPVSKGQSVIVEPTRPPATTSRAQGLSDAQNVPSSEKVLQSTRSSVVSGFNKSQVSSASRFSKRALAPHDSVSQMPRSSPGNTTSFRGLLTEEFLSQHRKKSEKQHGSSPASEAAASIKRATSKKPSVKVIDILEHPQRHLAGAAADTDTSSTSSSKSSRSSDDQTSFAFQAYSRVDPHKGRNYNRNSERHSDRHVSTHYHSDRYHERPAERPAERHSEQRTSRHNPNRRH